MSEPFIAEIRMFGGNFAPRGWAFCDGQLLPIAQYSALFSLLGTIYGGDGRTTFALPDLRGRFAVHEGSGPGLPTRSLGEKGGQATVQLTSNQLPAHTHPVTEATATASAVAEVHCESAKGNSKSPVGNFWSEDLGVQSATYKTPSGAPDSTMATGAVTVDVDVTVNNFNTGSAGATQSHENMPPFTTINYIIALQGTFPSRSSPPPPSGASIAAPTQEKTDPSQKTQPKKK